MSKRLKGSPMSKGGTWGSSLSIGGFAPSAAPKCVERRSWWPTLIKAKDKLADWDGSCRSGIVLFTREPGKEEGTHVDLPSLTPFSRRFRLPVLQGVTCAVR